MDDRDSGDFTPHPDVTPEMVEAVMDILLDCQDWDRDAGNFLPEERRKEFVSRVYEAIARLKEKSTEGNGQ